jgi:hypothetical protein
MASTSQTVNIKTSTTSPDTTSKYGKDSCPDSWDDELLIPATSDSLETAKVYVPTFDQKVSKKLSVSTKEAGVFIGDFPSLSQAAKITTVAAVSKGKTGKKKFSSSGEKVVLATSLIKELRNKRFGRSNGSWNSPDRTDVDQRTKVFETINNATSRESLKCTQMCSSVEARTLCPHGERCRFAHSLDQLKKSVCLFGEGCYFVNISKSGVFYNKKASGGKNKGAHAKICRRIHPGESEDNFYTRVGLAKFKPVVVKPKTDKEIETELADKVLADIALERKKIERALVLKEKTDRVAREMSEPGAWGAMINRVPVSCRTLSPELNELATRIENGLGGGKNGSGIVEPVSVITSGARRSGDTSGLGSNGKEPVSNTIKFVSGGVVEATIEDCDTPELFLDEGLDKKTSVVSGPATDENTVEEEEEEEEEETVLRVPIELALEALKMALASGLKNVRVEIV